MSMEILGVEMTPDVRQWRQPQRRVGSLLVLASAAALVVVGLVTWMFAKDAAAAFYWVLVVLLVLVLAAMAAILLVGSPGSRAAHGATPKYETPHYGPSGPKPAPEPSAAAKAASAEAAKPAAVKPTLQTLTLRCGDCGTVFDVDDTGERPLYHACPGCGAEGALRDAPVPPAPAPKAAAPSPSAPAQAPAAGLKRLKLRCGGCKEVFSIDDSGERPLRRPCPHCGRVGEIR